jgi:hypothetical protein
MTKASDQAHATVQRVDELLAAGRRAGLDPIAVIERAVADARQTRTRTNGRGTSDDAASANRH